VNRRTGQRIMYIQRRHWLDYDPIALAALVIGIGIIELLALIILTPLYRGEGQDINTRSVIRS
jgi:hypothetical protein